MAKLKKYRIEVDDFSPDTKNEIIAEHLGKGKTQDWLHHLKRHCTEYQKRQMLAAFYDKHINDHEWFPGILDFLLNSAIDTRFNRVVNNTIKIGPKTYKIIEE